MTFGERALWQRLRSKQMLGYDFNRQKPILHYIVDFYCITLMLAIEIDGSSHDENKYEYDLQRQKEIESLGIKFLRFTEYEVKTRIDDAISTIELFIIRNTPVANGDHPS